MHKTKFLHSTPHYSRDLSRWPELSAEISTTQFWYYSKAVLVELVRKHVTSSGSCYSDADFKPIPILRSERLQFGKKCFLSNNETIKSAAKPMMRVVCSMCLNQKAFVFDTEAAFRWSDIDNAPHNRINEIKFYHSFLSLLYAIAKVREIEKYYSGNPCDSHTGRRPSVSKTLCRQCTHTDATNGNVTRKKEIDTNALRTPTPALPICPTKSGNCSQNQIVY